MNETLPSVAKVGFDLYELENIYLNYLSEYEIFIESRFCENLIERTPEYEVIKHDKKQRVFRKEPMHEMFSIFLKTSRSWIQSIRTIVQPFRDDIFKHKNSFDGYLLDKNQDEYISPFLFSLASMLVDGQINIEGKCSQTTLTVAGLINYNIRTIKMSRITNLDNNHHDKEKETSISIYVGLKLYSTVRSRTLIDCLFQLGICMSYDKILSITKSLYEALHTIFGHYKIFLPTNLKKCYFTVSAKDHIDKNARANLVQSHFHGTGILLLQLLDHENQGESLDCHGFIDAVYNIKKLAPLSAEYT